ncbi:hypothetical protein [Prosthecobacter sp.]|uniref:hypothetical protein n=1 Tax=Prosthecobacter sp. TaxID=1965333 RepID=UPI00378412C0
MKTQESKDLHLLLDAVLSPESGHAGPTCTEVLGLLRQESRRQQQRRVRISMAAGAACLLAALLWSHNHASLPHTAPGTATTSRPPSDEAAPLVLRQVGDAQLFALLKDTPAALVKLPDGTDRLLILEP